MPGGKEILWNILFLTDTIVLCCYKDIGKIGNDNFLGGIIVIVPPKIKFDAVG